MNQPIVREDGWIQCPKLDLLRQPVIVSREHCEACKKVGPCCGNYYSRLRCLTKGKRR